MRSPVFETWPKRSGPRGPQIEARSFPPAILRGGSPHRP